MTGREAVLWGRPSAPADSPRRSILHCLRMLAPFRETAVKNGYDSADTAEGERQFYAFIKGLYGEMYGDPSFFLVPEKEYDEYLLRSGKPGWVGVAAEEAEGGHRDGGHKPDQKECRLRNRFQQAIQFYAGYLYELGTRALGVENGVLVLNQAPWQAARAAMERPHLRSENDKRFERLEALGLEERREEGRVFVSSRDFPKMFYGLWALCGAPDNAYRHMDYLRLDYRSALRGGPLVEDVLGTMPPEHAAMAKALDEAAGEWGARTKIKPLREITSGNRWKVLYEEKGKSAAGFYAGPDTLKLCIHFGEAKNISAMSARLRDSDPALADWFDAKFPERNCKCPNNRRVELGTGPRRICGLSNRAEIGSPDWTDLVNTLEVLRLFREKP